MNILKKIDAFILRFFQWVSDCLQTWIGWSPFSVAKVIFAAFLSYFFVCTIGNLLFIDLFTAVTRGLGFFYFGVMHVKRFREAIESCNSNGCRNVAEETFWWWRVFFVFMHILQVKNLLPRILEGNVAVIMEFMAWNCYICTIYLMSCTPKPPSQSKVRKLWNRLSEVFSPQLTPQPA